MIYTISEASGFKTIFAAIKKPFEGKDNVMDANT